MPSPPRVLLMALLTCFPVVGQQLEPRAYSVSPVGVNAGIFSYGTLDGDITFDPSVPVTDVKTVLNRFDLGYFRSIDFFGRSGNFTVVLPYTEGDLSGNVLGEFTMIRRSGLRDPAVRLAVNLYGAPAMRLKEFAGYQQKWLVGASFVAVAPLGQYDPARLINPGANRWSLKPEIGVSRALGRWTLEFAGGAWFFTANNNVQGRKRTQQPIGSGQIHVIYSFKPRLWASFDANYFVGGRTTLEGDLNANLQRNSRVGGTVSIPFGQRHSIKAGYSFGAFTTIGADFTSISLAYQYIWGGGL